VELAPHPEEEVQRLQTLRQLHRGEQPQRRQGVEIVQAMAGPRRPERRVEIPEPPRAFLDVGLLQEDRAPVPLVPPGLLLHLELDVLLGPASLKGPPHPILKLSEDAGAPGQEAGLQHGGPCREVRLHHPQGVTQRATTVAHAEAQVPEEIQDVIQDRGDVVVHPAGVQKHHVHIGAGIEFPSPVPAERHHGASFALLLECRRHDAVGQAEELADHRVYEIRMERHDLEPTGPTPMSRLDAGPLLGDKALHRREQGSPQRFSIRGCSWGLGLE
jgi:hypothetical protein